MTPAAATNGTGRQATSRARWIGLGACLILGTICLIFVGRGPRAREVRIFGPTATAEAAAAGEPAPVRILVASIMSPRRTTEQYAAFVAYLGAEIGRTGVLVQRRDYGSANDAIRRRDVDLALVCTGAYVRSEREGAFADLLAVPVVRGETTYRAYVIARADRPWRGLDDLEGRSMAFVDPLSLTGHRWVLHHLRAAGREESRFFSQVTYTGSHDRSIEAVALGLVDAASVDGLVHDATLLADPALGARVRIVERSEPFGMPPLVVPRALDPGLRNALLGALVTMHASPRGREVLAGLGIDRFEPAAGASARYDGARAIAADP